MCLQMRKDEDKCDRHGGGGGGGKTCGVISSSFSFILSLFFLFFLDRETTYLCESWVRSQQANKE